MRSHGADGGTSGTWISVGLLVVSSCFVGFSLFPGPLRADSCTVPGSHATIQEAVDDASCDPIELGAMSYSESAFVPRSLSIVGPSEGGAVIEGRFRASGEGTVVELVDLRVENGCSPAALAISGGASVQGTRFEAIRTSGGPCPEDAPLFSDGFESGDPSAWSSVTP